MTALRDLGARARTAVVLSMLAIGACSGGTVPEQIEMVFDAEGNLHVLTHLRAVEGEGYAGRSVDFLHARRGPDGWAGERPELPLMPWGEGAFYALAPWAAGDVALVTQVADAPSTDAQAAVLAHTPGGEWESVPMSDPAAEVFSRYALASWVNAEDELVVAFDTAIVETREDELALVREAPSLRPGCPVDHYEGTSLAVCFRGVNGVSLSELVCADSGCRWEDRPDHGLGSTGPVSEGTLVHTGAGVPTILHHLMNDLRLRVAGGGEERFVSDDVYHFGAARRPSGGLVIVTHHYYSDALALQLVPESYEEPVVPIDLATVAVVGWNAALPIVVTDDDHAHLVVATSSSTFSYFDVDLTGGFVREDFEI